MKLATTEDIYAVLPANLRLLRKRKGMSQTLFAAHLRIGMKAYAKHEEGKSQPPIRVCLAICQVGGVSLEDLLTKKLK